jgi:hypothetical protein
MLGVRHAQASAGSSEVRDACAGAGACAHNDEHMGKLLQKNRGGRGRVSMWENCYKKTEGEGAG